MIDDRHALSQAVIIRPQIAQTIVHLGIDLHGVITKATLADALQLAMKRTGFTVSHADA